MTTPLDRMGEHVAEDIVIRPPSEANSIIIQATRGCSHNRCIFCGVYKGSVFGITSENDIDRQLDFARQHCTHQSRVFIGAGDALILSQATLLELFDKITVKLPWVTRISLYANGRAIRSKSDADLEVLKRNRLDRIYMGIESGDDYLLDWMKKGETAATMEVAGTRVVAAGIFLSTTVLLGIAGRERSKVHAQKTAALLNRIKPNQIAALSLMPLDNTELGRLCRSGEFVELSAEQTSEELKTLISSLTIDRVQFMANHASNYVPLSGRLQKDKKKFLRALDQALDDPALFVPHHLRAL